MDKFKHLVATCKKSHLSECVALVLPEEKSQQQFQSLPNCMTFKEFHTMLWNVDTTQSRFNVCGS